MVQSFCFIGKADQAMINRRATLSSFLNYHVIISLFPELCVERYEYWKTSHQQWMQLGQRWLEIKSWAAYLTVLSDFFEWLLVLFLLSSLLIQQSWDNEIWMKLQIWAMYVACYGWCWVLKTFEINIKILITYV